uniref:Flavin reductase like domain-containing protein n=1 Tax=Fusarium oxysporum (strain Fo5176) TaxID=660025 RepID=A0A0D2XK75_FUSOF
MFALRCRVLKDAPEGGLLRVRDHVIVVGEVVEMVRVGEEEDEEFGLVYADRRYREVGVVLEINKRFYAVGLRAAGRWVFAIMIEFFPLFDSDSLLYLWYLNSQKIDIGAMHVELVKGNVEESSKQWPITRD